MAGSRGRPYFSMSAAHCRARASAAARPWTRRLTVRGVDPTGYALLLLLFGFVVWRILRAAQLARDPFGTLICVGVLSMLLFQVFQSVGMNTGIMPITGIPFPFMSYGGSSTLTSFIAIGLVLNVHMRRFS